MAVEKLKYNKSTGIDQIPAELIKGGGRITRCEIYTLIISIWNRQELPEEWKESIIVPIQTQGDRADCSNYRGISQLPTTYRSLSIFLLSRLTPYAEEIIRDHQCGFHATGPLLIIYSAFVKYLRKNGNTSKQCISSIQTSRKLVIQSGGRSCIIFSLSLVSSGYW